MSHRNRITDPAQALQFLLAGNATITLVSTKTGTRFTYKVRQPKAKSGRRDDGTVPHFVKVLRGSDNESDYTYMGTIFERKTFRITKKSRHNWLSPCVKAFNYFMFGLISPTPFIQDKLEVWHEGTCGRCGRKLTVPESIATGLGPECAKMAGVKRVKPGVATKTVREAEQRALAHPAVKDGDLDPGSAIEAELADMEAEADRQQTIQDEEAKAEARARMESGDPQQLIDWMARASA